MQQNNLQEIYKDIFNYFNAHGNDFLFSKTVLENYKITYKNKYKAIASKLLSNPEKETPIVFVGAKYKDCIKEMRPYGVVVVGSIKYKLVTTSLGVDFYGDEYFVSQLYYIYTHKDIQSLEKLINNVQQMLRNKHAKTIFLINDSLPLERLFIHAAKLSGILSICIQHGLFSRSGGSINDGKCVDIMCAYDEYQAEILRATGAKNVRVFGYYSNIKNNNNIKIRRKEVCILGQPWVDYYTNKGAEYIGMLNEVTYILSKNQIVWYYKPHPSEKRPEIYVPDFNKHIYKKSLKKTLKRFDIFISPTSTSLLEASLHRKLSIQIYLPELCNEIFSELNYSITIDFKNINEELIRCIKSENPITTAIDSSNLLQRLTSISNLNNITD